MDQTRFSTIAHADRRYLGPLSTAKAEALMDALDLAPGDRVLDIGCGKGEFLLRLLVAEGLAAHRDDPDWRAMRDRIHRWRDAYLRWGRDTLGFGYYLFRTRDGGNAW